MSNQKKKKILKASEIEAIKNKMKMEEKHAFNFCHLLQGNFGTIFVDQSYWQSSVAAKPKQGVIGFLLGGICWFAIPFGLATTTSLAYIALSASQNQALLSDSDVDAGKM